MIFFIALFLPLLVQLYFFIALLLLLFFNYLSFLVHKVQRKVYKRGDIESSKIGELVLISIIQRFRFF